jgi:acyl carrier protein
MDNKSQAQSMIEFLRIKVLRDASVELDEHTPLVSSGLVDSFALVEVLLELEKVTQRRIPARDVSPSDLDTVMQMLITAERVGKLQ